MSVASNEYDKQLELLRFFNRVTTFQHQWIFITENRRLKLDIASG